MLYAENYTGNGELHSVAFTGVLPAVPEPATYAMFGIGLAGVLMAARKRKQA